MLVFVTGASGFIGSAVVLDLLHAGHRVLGLARSPASAASLVSAGALVHHGSLSDLASLKSGAAKADGVVHLAFNADFSNYAAVCEMDRLAIEAMGEALAGTGKPLVVTKMGRIWGASDVAALALAEKKVRVSVVRLPPTVHGEGEKGFIPMLVSAARAGGESMYIGDGLNRWPAVHRLDAAVVFRLALEKGGAGKSFHAVGEEAVVLKDVAGVIGRELGVPVVSRSFEEAQGVLGFVATPVSMDNPTSSQWTREVLGWSPRQVGLIADLEQGHYFGK
ncbi:Uncharacterized protein LOCC1_G002699 [Lachnellula occidentalis]|uniref:NAD-dependent epimerase/dehydratase domain-containing protein n=1 Tax=Lachnellula occidentalis TaxID=215460 RepID=A0A8H8S4C6_9HELO|nr:Uncharacterized protein LOCC1_G002699 [Lachnellula occidentalis]